MNLTGFFACVIVFLDCIDHALGDQTIFSASALWLWWPVAVVWLVAAGRFAYAGITTLRKE